MHPEFAPATKQLENNTSQESEPITELTPAPNTIDKGGHMSMIDESCIVVSARRAAIDTTNPTELLPTHEAEWFARPIQIGAGSMPTTLGTFFSHTPVPGTFPTPWAEKLVGYVAIRYKIVYTVVFATTPFHAGLTMASWEPVATRIGFKFDRSSNVTAFQLPNGLVDHQDATALCMECPWSNNVPFQTVNSTSSEQSPGTFRLNALVPVLSPPGSAVPTFTVFMHLEDVAVIGGLATDYSNLQPQSRRDKISATGTIKKAKGVIEDLRASKAISTTLGMGSKVAEVLSAVPLVSSVAAPAAWAMRWAANTAARWGFSKPLANEPLTRVAHGGMEYDHNATGGETATNLSLFHDTAVDVAAAAGASVDEMSFEYLCGMPGLLSRFNITNQVSKTLVYAAWCCPCACYWQGASRVAVPIRDRLAVLGTAPFPGFNPAPCMVPSSITSFWKGDMIYHFRFIKTRFHTGRIALTFAVEPDAYGAEALGTNSYYYPTYDGTYTLDRVLIDLKECDSYDMVVPFTNNMPALAQANPMGRICMYVVDPIKAPENVTPGVVVLVSVSMRNVEFSGLTGTPYAPTQVTTNPLFEPQSRREGGGTLFAATGEPVETFNTVLKRHSVRTTLRQPYALTLPTYIPNTTAPTAVDASQVDLIDIVRSAFAFERGGMVVRVLPTSDVSTVTYTSPSNIGSFFQRMTVNPLDHPTAYYFDSARPVVKAYVPRLSVFPVYKADHGGIPSPQTALREPSRLPGGISSTLTGAASRAVGDDHQFLYFIGFPAMTRGFVP